MGRLFLFVVLFFPIFGLDKEGLVEIGASFGWVFFKAYLKVCSFFKGDGGIDGRGRFPIRKGVFIDVVSQVKGGSTEPSHVQAFNAARQQAHADLGIFTCFEDKVTQGMRDVAASSGKFKGVPCIQIYTVEDYFEKRRPIIPLAA